MSLMNQLIYSIKSRSSGTFEYIFLFHWDYWATYFNLKHTIRDVIYLIFIYSSSNSNIKLHRPSSTLVHRQFNSFELSSPFLWPCVHTYQFILPLRSDIWCNILTHLWLCTRVFCLETKARNKYTPLKCSSSHLCPCQLINKSLVGQEFADKVDPNW